MSIIKHPITLALLAAALVFAVTYYYFNNYQKTTLQFTGDKDDKSDKSDKKKSKKNKDEKKNNVNGGVNETIIILSAIAGLITWYIATNYFSDKTINLQNESNNNTGSNIQTNIQTNPTNNQTNRVESNQTQVNQMSKPGINNGSKTGYDALRGGSISPNKVPHINSDDPTRSYNLIGSGLDIPRSELKIPNVLIDYH